MQGKGDPDMTINIVYLARLRRQLARAIEIGDLAAATMLRARIAALR